jgi:DNA modification methylase
LWFTKSDDDYTFNAHKIDKTICQSKRTTFFDTGKCSGNERIVKYDGTAFHPCQKPEKLFESLLLTHSNRGDRVADPFLGTGTTAVLATKWSRKFWGSEQNPEYFDAALKRTMFPIGGYPDDYENDDVVEEALIA